jgi:predicted O-linked N-acetylglucosamine transferase (SPINDLY family)
MIDAPAPGSYERALALHRHGKIAEAELLYAEVLQLQRDHPGALHMLGMAKLQSGHLEAGMALIERSLELDPRQAAAHSSLGNALRSLHRPREALAHYELALELDPDHAPAHNNRGSTLLDLGRPQEALESYERALRLRPDHVGALYNCGNVLLNQGRPAEALAHYDRALFVQPDFALALYARAKALRLLRRLSEALASLDRGLAADPALAGNAEVHMNRGDVLADQRRLEEAVASYERAIHLDPRLAPAHFSCATALAQLSRHDAAAIRYAGALALAAQFPFALGGLLQSRLMQCDWSDWDIHAADIARCVNDGHAAVIPFVLLAVSDCASTQLKCARTYLATSFPPAPRPLWNGERYEHRRIRLAYVSADFREHPVAQLIVGVLEKHDRKRFETIAVSLRPPDASALGRRVRNAVERVFDADDRTDDAIADELRRMEVDILVDLQGFTQGERVGILARRPAPIQASYLGFPATMGADFIDYLIADATVIPKGAEHDYVEHVVRLPHSYLPFDDRQTISARAPSRLEVGLPADGVVFCAFNNHYKITPAMFAIWMRLLRDTPGSCLWLRAASSAVIANLRREALAHGIAGDRLVFAAQIPEMTHHLARMGLADLFLDTLPYNAHATAANALWTGLPVVTCAGRAFAGRVAASLLRAAGLPGLIAQDPIEYERLARVLAHDTEWRMSIRAELLARRRGAPLFDTDRYRRSLESAFVRMHARLRRGERPAPFDVPAFE